MHPRLEKAIKGWLAAGVVDSATAERIRNFETEHEKSAGLRWPVLLALAFGAVLMASGVLLFVAAHWDELSPAWRFSLVLLMTAAFHVGGALAISKFPALSSALHAAGTATLGGGISLAGQVFHLEEHWPGGIMMWAAGAWVAWALLRDWPQAALAAILTPAWLAAEWAVAAETLSGGQQVLAQGQLLLALTYLSLRTKEHDGPIERSLMWIGGIALVPCAILASQHWWDWGGPLVPQWLLAVGWTVSLGAPMAIAYWRRGRDAWINLVSALWVAILASMTSITKDEALGDLFQHFWRDFGLYLWLWLGSIGLIWWGIRESRRERVNLGIACFGITVLTFYFASVMDKLGRSVSLIGLGVLFFVCGWFLERARRRLLGKMETAA